MQYPWRVEDSWIATDRAAARDREVHRTFADEVAIDFPSVAPAVERMRQPFIEPDAAEPLLAHIWLSARQADAGAAVTVEIPLRWNCRCCGGRGEAWGEPCHPCAGTGHSSAPRALTISVPAGVSDGECFSFSVTPPRGPRTRVDVRVAIT